MSSWPFVMAGSACVDGIAAESSILSLHCLLLGHDAIAGLVLEYPLKPHRIVLNRKPASRENSGAQTEKCNSRDGRIAGSGSSSSSSPQGIREDALVFGIGRVLFIISSREQHGLGGGWVNGRVAYHALAGGGSQRMDLKLTEHRKCRNGEITVGAERGPCAT